MKNNFYTILVSILMNNTRMISYFAVIPLLIAATVIDIRERRIPDKLVLAGVAAGMVITQTDPSRRFTDSLMGGISAGIVLLLIHYITKGGIGLGDAKLFGCVGIYLGMENIASAMLIAAVLSGLYSLALICINRDNKKHELPFAPFILIGTLVAIIF